MNSQAPSDPTTDIEKLKLRVSILAIISTLVMALFVAGWTSGLSYYIERPSSTKNILICQGIIAVIDGRLFDTQVLNLPPAVSAIESFFAIIPINNWSDNNWSEKHPGTDADKNYLFHKYKTIVTSEQIINIRDLRSKIVGGSLLSDGEIQGYFNNSNNSIGEIIRLFSSIPTEPPDVARSAKAYDEIIKLRVGINDNKISLIKAISGYLGKGKPARSTTSDCQTLLSDTVATRR